MEIWVLIIGLYLTGDHGGVAVASVEFNSQAACVEAGKRMAAEWSRGSASFRDQSRWICTKK